jgi:hypothetical protein
VTEPTSVEEIEVGLVKEMLLRLVERTAEAVNKRKIALPKEPPGQ